VPRQPTPGGTPESSVSRPAWSRGGSRTSSTGPVSRPSTRPPPMRRTASGAAPGYEYARTQNPTRERLERAVAELEGAAFGSRSRRGRPRRPPSSSSPRRGAARGRRRRLRRHVSLLRRVARPRGVLARYVDLAAGVPPARGDTRRSGRHGCGRDASNRAEVTDIALVASAAHAHAGARGAAAIVVVDNTFASPRSTTLAWARTCLPFRDEVPLPATATTVRLAVTFPEDLARAAPAPSERDRRRGTGPQDATWSCAPCAPASGRAHRNAAATRPLPPLDSLAATLTDGPFAHHQAISAASQMASAAGWEASFRHGPRRPERPGPRGLDLRGHPALSFAESLGGVDR